MTSNLIFATSTIYCKYLDNVSSQKIHQGVTDAGATSIQEIIPEIRARYIRINPLSWNNRICLRAELYGCEPHQANIGMDISVYKLSCSTQYHSTIMICFYEAANSSLYFNGASFSHSFIFCINDHIRI